MEENAEHGAGRDLLVVGRDADYPLAVLYAHLARRQYKEAYAFDNMEDALHMLGLESIPASMPSWQVEAMEG